MGIAFLTKMLQGFLVLPGFAAAYLIAAPASWRNRLLHVAAATGVLIVTAGWWVAHRLRSSPRPRGHRLRLDR